ncbi:S66 peptidase family protein [Sediminitomix flava]|uniref:Muramoyltetrapeptide carboxypeptidase n=1 Tax=Sediminitomix flava TaxID=379075 RepID=A0A315ZFW7_SEDFL|nr:LD-carboxypeptidase [Sediminitomix flava]PWJ44411.1 muramoyltetrapeptide carboxypeptidase [Sediminitomix flava]
MKQPSFLKKGDTIAIIAPSSPAPLNKIEAGFSYLESWGLNVLEGKYIRDSYGSLAATDEQRLEDIQWAFDHPEVKAVLCTRGGYGLTRILDQIDMTKFVENPKWLIGFSDITALHYKINSENVQSLHACMLAQMGLEDSLPSRENLKQFLFGEGLEPLLAEASPLNRIGSAQGVVVGGNLALVNDQVGSLVDIDMKGKILFIEEIGEYRYTIDRMMTHLKRCGKLDHLAALVIGQITDTRKNDENEFPLTPEEIITEKVKEFDYPVAFNFAIGHEQPNYPLVLGCEISIEVNESGSILSHLS